MWSRLVRAKYGVSLDASLSFSLKARASIIWRGVEWCLELLHSGLRWEVLSERTRFWSDKWLMDAPFHEGCKGYLTPDDLQLTGANYWAAGQGWKWSEVGDLLLASNLLKLSSFVLDDQSLQRDQMHLMVLHGRFLVWAAYRLAVGDGQEGAWDGWMLIWRLRFNRG